VDTDTGEFQERRLQHREQAENFYRHLRAQGIQVRVAMEASGQARWFERLLSELHFELWIGDAAEIRTKRVRKQKTEATPSTRAKWRSSLSACSSALEKCLTRADIVREAIYQQLGLECVRCWPRLAVVVESTA
jgi:hypothetical protein